MKYLFIIMMVFALLVSCSNAPSEKAIQTAIAETQTVQPPITIPTVPTATRTLKGASSTLASPTASRTEIITLAASNTPPTTEDLLFYNF